MATYHPFKDEEITRKTRLQNEGVSGYSCFIDIGYSSGGEWELLNRVEKKVIGERLDITEAEYLEQEKINRTIKNAQGKLEIYKEQYKNVQNLIAFAQDENTKIAYQNALSAIDREFQLTQDFIKKTQEEISGLNSKYTNECPIKYARYGDDMKFKKDFNPQQINEVLGNIDYDEVNLFNVVC